MSHSHAQPNALPPVSRRARAVLVACVALIGLAAVVGLVLLWPGAMARHVDRSLAGATVGPSPVRARVDAVSPASCRGVPGTTQQTLNSMACGRLDFTVLEGATSGATGFVTVPRSTMLIGPHAGETIIVAPLSTGNAAAYQLVDFERAWPLALLGLGFVVVVGLVARWRGLLAVVGLGVAGLLLGTFVFPALVSGEDALLVGVVGAVAIMIVVIYTAHGVTARSTTALLGTVAGVVLCALMARAAVGLTRLTGVSQEDDVLLGAAAPDLHLVAALTCGILIAGLGVLNDVTITQASAVWELADAAPDARTLFAKAMRIGRDHIASTIYTIAFATAGAAMTTFLLITVYGRPLGQLVQSELFAEEVVRTLVGATGLVLAVPITTAVAVAVVRSGARRGTKAAPAPESVA